MPNRMNLLVLVAFTAIAGFVNGCDNTDGEPDDSFRPADFGGVREESGLTVPWCDYGSKPCGLDCIDQYDSCGIAALDAEDAAGELDLVSRPTDWCVFDPDSWGCPGMPCVHGACWDGDGWADACEGEVRDTTGNVVDPGTCAE